MKTVADTDLKRLEDLIINGQKAIETRFTAIETRFTVIETRFTAIENSIVEIKADIGEIKADIKEIKQDVKSLEALGERQRPHLEESESMGFGGVAAQPHRELDLGRPVHGVPAEV